jgi:hypothetical protein
MITAAEVFVVLAALGLVVLGLRAYAPAWLLYAFAVLLGLGAVERVFEEGPTVRRVAGVSFYALLVAAYVYALRRQPPGGSDEISRRV